MNHLERNIKLIYAFNFLTGLMFFLPIFALYLQKELFTVFNVTLILSLKALFTLIFEVPSGAIADIFGRKRVLIASIMIEIIGFIFLSLGGNISFFIIFAILSAFAESLISGTDTAILYDSLKEMKQEKKFKKVIGINSGMWPVAASIGSAFGGFLAAYSLRLPIYLTIIPYACALLLAIFIVEPKYEKADHNNIFRHIIDSAKKILKNKQLLVVFITGLMSYALAEVIHQLKPVFFEFKEIPITLFGIIFAVTFGLSFLGSYFSHNISERFGNKKTILAGIIFSLMTGVIATYLLGYWAAFFVVLGSLAWGIELPIRSHILNEAASSKERVTIISFSHLVNRLGFAISAPIFGQLAGIININNSVRIGYFLLIIPFLIILLFLKEK